MTDSLKQQIEELQKQLDSLKKEVEEKDKKPRYSKLDVIFDLKQNLEWTEGPNEDTTYEQAEKWMENLGKAWRFPKEEELVSLFSSEEKSPFNNMDVYVWLDKTDTGTGYIEFYIERKSKMHRRNSDDKARSRVLAVREM